ncbi:MAG: potassium channel family protein [Rhodospirillales bacterium]
MLSCLSSGAIATGAYVGEGWSLGDAFYMVVITIYTVGYDEVRPIDTPLLRTITLSLIVAGCTGMIFVTGALVQLITASQFQQLLGIRRMQKDISALEGHVVVCGYGRIGQMLARELRDGRLVCVIVERDEARLKLAIGQGFAGLQADATDEEVLRAAGRDARPRAGDGAAGRCGQRVHHALGARPERGPDHHRPRRGAEHGKETAAGRRRTAWFCRPISAPSGVAEIILFQEMGQLLEGESGETGVRPRPAPAGAGAGSGAGRRGQPLRGHERRGTGEGSRGRVSGGGAEPRPPAAACCSRRRTR